MPPTLYTAAVFYFVKTIHKEFFFIPIFCLRIVNLGDMEKYVSPDVMVFAIVCNADLLETSGLYENEVSPWDD